MITIYSLGTTSIREGFIRSLRRFCNYSCCGMGGLKWGLISDLPIWHLGSSSMFSIFMVTLSFYRQWSDSISISRAETVLHPLIGKYCSTTLSFPGAGKSFSSCINLAAKICWFSFAIIWSPKSWWLPMHPDLLAFLHLQNSSANYRAMAVCALRNMYPRSSPSEDHHSPMNTTFNPASLFF